MIGDKNWKGYGSKRLAAFAGTTEEHRHLSHDGRCLGKNMKHKSPEQETGKLPSLLRGLVSKPKLGSFQVTA